MSTTLRFLFISILVFAMKPSGTSQTVFIVRHAEKDLSSSNPKDPALNSMGLARSYALRDKLKKNHLAAIYSTDYKRTRETAAPIAIDKGLEIQLYDPQNLDSFASALKQQFRGKSVLIVGHSNTILETIKELGGSPSKDQIGDQEYSNLFIVRITKSGKVKTMTTQYGL